MAVAHRADIIVPPLVEEGADGAVPVHDVASFVDVIELDLVVN